MNTKKFKLKVNRLFKLLEKSKCCAKQTCAWGAFDDPYKNWYFVFTTEQSYHQYLDGTQYIYGEYPPQIYDLIDTVGLTYKQRDKDSAIELLPIIEDTHE